MKVEKIIELAVRVIRNSVGKQCKIYLFGSQAKLEAGPHSDIDIALHGNKPIPPIQMVQIKEKLDHIPTLRSIEVLDLLSISRDFRNSILKEGRRIHG